ncbi:MAG: 16S rRNA (adenine(1518)-N(6)/adenine(1519)-N(6))-dimethyltransferase RsmA [Patescibacteria group bacterium]
MTRRSSRRSPVRPNKLLGQHFLVNQGIIVKIISAAALNRGDVVVEVGPGRGALTFALAHACKKVIAVEKDRALAQELREKCAHENIVNVEVVTGDILKFLAPPSLLLPPRYVVVANIPYYLTSALVRALLEQKRTPDTITLMMQKEVAQRMCARNGKESILSLSVKFYAEPKVLFSVSRGSFFPPPTVDSAVIRLTPRKTPLSADPERFFPVVKAGFSAPRKKLVGNLARALSLDKERVASVLHRCRIAPNARAADLPLSQWVALAAALQ